MTANCVGCYRILNSIMHYINLENHTSNKYPIHFSTGSLISQGWVRLRGDAHKKIATRILASSTKMRNNFSIDADELYLLSV